MCVYLIIMATIERYLEIQREFEENGCVLQTSFEKFVEIANEKAVSLLLLSFIGKCGHPSSAVYTNFHKRKTGIICKSCVKKNKKPVMDKNLYAKQESISVSYLKAILSNDYDVIQTNEGCSADMLLRKKSNTDDLWFQIQVKTTKEKCHEMYSFQGIDYRYKDMIVICHSLCDNKIWMFPYNYVKVPRKLNISDTSKYNIHLYKESELPIKIIDFTSKCKLVTEVEGNYQANKYQQREAVYAKKRKEILTFLEFTKSDIQYTSTDFTVNDKKVQEKVVGSKHGNSYKFQLARKNGMNDRNRNYRLGENNVYWFHSAFDERFWIVPEEVLFTNGLLSKPDETKPQKHFKVNPTTYKSHTWLKHYEFDYTKITSEVIIKIKGLFSIM
jgi:hypothetical protein